jgi:hypothetical protein
MLTNPVCFSRCCAPCSMPTLDTEKLAFSVREGQGQPSATGIWEISDAYGRVQCSGILVEISSELPNEGFWDPVGHVSLCEATTSVSRNWWRWRSWCNPGLRLRRRRRGMQATHQLGRGSVLRRRCLLQMDPPQTNGICRGCGIGVSMGFRPPGATACGMGTVDQKLLGLQPRPSWAAQDVSTCCDVCWRCWLGAPTISVGFSNRCS